MCGCCGGAVVGRRGQDQGVEYSREEEEGEPGRGSGQRGMLPRTCQAAGHTCACRWWPLTFPCCWFGGAVCIRPGQRRQVLTRTRHQCQPRGAARSRARGVERQGWPSPGAVSTDAQMDAEAAVDKGNADATQALRVTVLILKGFSRSDPRGCPAAAAPQSPGRTVAVQAAGAQTHASTPDATTRAPPTCSTAHVTTHAIPYPTIIISPAMRLAPALPPDRSTATTVLPVGPAPTTTHRPPPPHPRPSTAPPAGRAAWGWPPRAPRGGRAAAPC